MNYRGDKRTLGNDNISIPHGKPRKQKRCSSPDRTDDVIRNGKMIMGHVKHKLSEYELQDTPTNKLIQYVREIITKLDTTIKKKSTVGVFGKTGAGKSSLINAILGETDLLPSGTLCACTSVIIQVGANLTDFFYTAEIEFISKKEWEDELKMLLNVLSEDGEEKDNAIFSTANEKITAMYGEEGVFMTIDDLMKDDNFSEIPEFLRSQTKKLTCEKASELSDQIGCYVQHDDSNPGGCYWPVVKSVTINVPYCKEFLEHILLVDLPGTGDYNKSRDQMWKSKLRECSTVWIVSEINRAGSDKEAWELISNSVGDMAQGGECSSICFICTKTDDINPGNYMRSSKLKDEDFQITPADSQYASKKKTACILHRNAKAKEKVKKNFLLQDQIKTNFDCDDDFFSVFTVSSEEFTKEDPILKKEETEIPKLKDLLRTYNNSHTNEMASQYIAGALGILSLIQGFKEINAEMVGKRSSLYQDLEINLHNALGHLHECCQQICSSLEELLSKGAKESEEKCVETANQIIAPKKDGRGFHRTLTALCKNDGFYRSKKGTTDLNSRLASHMLQYINEAFSEFFPVQGKATEKSLQAKMVKFTIVNEEVMVKYENSPVLRHMMKFLKIEEMKLKKMLKQKIVEQKKTFYASLPESIKSTLLQGYRSAAAITGIGSMKKKQTELLEYIESSKSYMFQKAKREMIEMMDRTMHSTVEEIKTGLKASMEYSLLNTNTLSFMDVSKETEELKKLSTQICD